MCFVTAIQVKVILLPLQNSGVSLQVASKNKQERGWLTDISPSFSVNY